METPLKNVDQGDNSMMEKNIANKHNALISQPVYEENSSIAVAIPKQEFSGDFTELDQQIQTLTGRGENMVEYGRIKKRMNEVFVCQVCGKESGQKIHMKDHIEANHLEGIYIPCKFCEKTFRSRKSFRHHNSYFHTIHK